MENESIFLFTSITIIISSLLKYYSSFKIIQNKEKKNNIIEICLSDIESVKNSINGGINSIELCIDRNCGGITPSFGLIKEVCRIANDQNINVNILIRPRGGNFVYTDDEFDVILRDIICARDAGAHGVVVGILRPDHTIDTVRMAVIRAISHPMSLTFHRAFDVCSTPLTDAIDLVISLGCDRLLTSGRSLYASDPNGIQNLHTIIKYINHKRNCKHPGYYTAGHSLYLLQVIAASGIKSSNVREIILSTGVDGIHAGSGVINKNLKNIICLNTVDENLDLKKSFEDVNIGVVDEDLVSDLVDIASESWEEIHQCLEPRESS